MRDPKDVTILIVDDEPALRKAIVFDFKRKGFKVLDAGNGKDAFELVQRHEIDVVLTDVRMPGGDGIELLDKIKQLNPKLPVVMFITGFADMSLEDAYDKGADAVFSKPFNRKALLEAVLTAVSPKDEVWAHRNHERFKVDIGIELQFTDLNLAIQGRVLNIGRGGLFIALKDSFPNVEAKAAFRIRFDAGIPSGIEGEGTVRWIRTQVSEALPTGCGIEFLNLSDQSRREVINFINQLKTKAFIPKV